MDEMCGTYVRYWEKRNAYRVVLQKTEERKPLERHRRRWDDNIMIDLKEIW
jgi:hypothetical protein